MDLLSTSNHQMTAIVSLLLRDHRGQAYALYHLHSGFVSQLLDIFRRGLSRVLFFRCSN